LDHPQWGWLGMGKKRPGERTCLGCGKKVHKTKLFRVVVQEGGVVLFDFEQHEPGRGGYFCPQEKCFLKAAKQKKRLDSRFRKEILFEPADLIRDIHQRLVQEYKRIIQNEHGRAELTQQLMEGLSLEDLQIILSNKNLNYRSICRG